MVTLPGGSTEGFTFYGRPGTVFGSAIFDWFPTFIPDPGVTSELIVSEFSLQKVDDEYVDLATGLAYNPAHPLFGNAYNLVTRSGLTLAINATTGRLASITDRNGNTLYYTGNGITSDSGCGIEFERDYLGRITSVIDPAGYSVDYEYDSAGNLISVTDRLGATTQFTYLTDPEHYLDKIIDPLGVQAAQTEYDADGRVSKVIDADGQTIEYAYDAVGHTQTVTDQLGYETTLTFDARGNVLREEDPTGGITLRTYDADDNLLTQTTVVGQQDNPQNGETDDLTVTSTYNASGDLLSRTDAAGNTTYFTYTFYGAPLTTTDPLGNTTQNLFDARGNLVGTVDPQGNSTSFAYDLSGNLTVLTDPLGNNSFMSYNAYGEVTGRTDALGNQTTFTYDSLGHQTGTSFDWTNPDDPNDVRTVAATTEYDAAGRVITTVDAQGNERETEYNAVGQVTTTTDEFGHETVNRYDGRGQLIETVYADGTLTRTVYDAKGRAVYRVDAHVPGESANGTQTLYDAADRVVETRRLADVVIDIVSNSGVLSSELDSAGSLLSKTTSTYDNAGRLTASTRTRAGETLSSTSYEYDGLGRQAAVERTTGSTTLRTEYEYDQYGRTMAVIDPYDRETHYLYDSFGRQTVTIHHTGAQSETTFDELGRVASTTSFEGVVRTYEYDSLGRQTAMEVTADGTTSRTEYEYDAYGNQSLVRDALDHETTFTYDEFGRTVATTYDDDSQTAITYDTYGRVLSETDAMGLTREYEYDDMSRLAAVILPAVTHPDTGQTVRPRYEYEYDDQGNQTLIRDNVVQLTNGTVLYDHDGNTGDDVRETTFTYDDFGRQTSRTLPEGQTESFEYDEYGRQTLHVDFAGRVTEYVFDDSSTGLGRLDEKRFFDNLTQYDDGNGTPAETVQYTYDDLGRVLTIVDDRGTTSYTYNNDGRTTKIDSPEGIIRYEYEPITNRLTRTYTTDSAGEVLNDFEYTYDSLGRLKTVSVVERNDEELATPETTSYSYDLVGNLDRVDQPNGIVTDYEYDELNRLDKLTHYEPDATPEDLSDNDKIAEFDYDVRADGRRTGVTETYYDSGSPETIEIDWTYDNLGRLVDEVFNHYDDMLDQTLEFSYDLVGNRLEQTKDSDNDGNVDEKTTYTYDDNDRLLTESLDADNDGNVDQTTTYSYTATEQTGKTVIDESTGNTLSQTDFTYNLQGRLESVTIKTYDSSENLTREEVTTYDYDDNGFRVSALHEVDSDADGNFDTRTLTEYLADPRNHTGYTQTIEETVTDADTGVEIKKIVSTIGHDVIAQTTFTPSGPTEGDTIVLLYDGHGSTRLVADLAAQILEAYAYDAYGNAIGFDPGAALTSLLYSGEAFDSRINQQYLRARWYDAATGRFNRLDPFAGNLRDPQSLHKYLYTHGDPVNGIDPTGRSFISLIAGIGGRIGMFAAKYPAMFGAISGGATGFVDAYLENYSVRDGLEGAVWGAVLGGILGRVFGSIFKALGPLVLKLPPQLQVRLLQALFAANFTGTAYSVFTAKSTGQGLFRAGLGLIGLTGNGLAIRRVKEWARKLAKADTLVLASTGDGPLSSNAVHNNLYSNRLPENLGDAIPLVADQADLPLPAGHFNSLIGRRIQIASPNHPVPPPGLRLKTFKEWFRVMKSGGTLEVSIANEPVAGVLEDLAAAGFSNATHVTGHYHPPSSFVFTAIKN